jgi:hypothetical protein
MPILTIYFGQELYWKGCKKKNFQSRLPQDLKQQHLEAIDKATPVQETLDDHLHKVIPTEQVIPYSDTLFHEAAIEWLVSTDQVFNYIQEISLC